MSEQEYVDVYRRYLGKFEERFGDLAFIDEYGEGLLRR